MCADTFFIPRTLGSCFLSLPQNPTGFARFQIYYFHEANSFRLNRNGLEKIIIIVKYRYDVKYVQSLPTLGTGWQFKLTVNYVLKFTASDLKKLRLVGQSFLNKVRDFHTLQHYRPETKSQDRLKLPLTVLE